eukprot:SAG25_NODE_206_length_11883_cov_5.639511_6_plen_170_part_00
MCQKTPQKGTSTPKGRKTGGNVTKVRTSATTTKKRARLRLSPGGNGEGKKSPLRRLPTDHRESLTQTGLRLASSRGTVVGREAGAEGDTNTTPNYAAYSSRIPGPICGGNAPSRGLSNRWLQATREASQADDQEGVWSTQQSCEEAWWQRPSKAEAPWRCCLSTKQCGV